MNFWLDTQIELSLKSGRRNKFSITKQINNFLSRQARKPVIHAPVNKNLKP